MWCRLAASGFALLALACGSDGGEAANQNASGGSGAGGSSGATGGAAGQGAGAGSSASGGTIATGGAAGAGATGGTSPGSGGSAASAGAGASGGSAGSGNCVASTLAPGSSTDIELQVDGRGRSYLIHVPSGYDGSAPLPLVLNFHGYLYTSALQVDYTGMSTTSDAQGFLVAYPQGTDNSWNAGACCGQAASNDVDDVSYARAVVADIQSKICVDPKRIYAGGMSNGGFMSHRLACEATDLFAAIAPVDGVLGINPSSCQPSRPISVMHFHGTSDLIVPYGGNPAINYPSVADTIAGWVQRNGCSGAPTTTFQNGKARCETHGNCDAGTEVTLCTIDGMGHCWPGRTSCLTGSPNTDISATNAMWEFFKRYTLP